jgi:hypothetical protein
MTTNDLLERTWKGIISAERLKNKLVKSHHVSNQQKKFHSSVKDHMAQTIQQAVMHTHLEGRRLLPFKTRKSCLNWMCSSTLLWFSAKADYIIIEKGYSQIILLKLFPIINGL